ncbi:MAG: alpha/beta hydrolase [Clostridia bacterium]|nr:alpha/beta hydrolase [Clostridia bacterium]
MEKTINLENKTITIFYNENNKKEKIPVIILNTFDEDGEDIWNKVKTITDKEYVLVTISNINWNKEMSPWYMDKLFKSEDNYEGKADEYIELLSKRIIPKVEKILKQDLEKDIDNYIIAGYSLAGLFAIYSLYKTNIFTSVISCSGSLWYPNFIEYVENNELKTKPDKIYFSLGNRECKTKNELMSKVEEKTKYLEQYYNNKNIKTIYEENEGNHFQDVTNRIAKGIKWILN